MSEPGIPFGQVGLTIIIIIKIKPDFICGRSAKIDLQKKFGSAHMPNPLNLMKKAPLMKILPKKNPSRRKELEGDIVLGITHIDSGHVIVTLPKSRFNRRGQIL